MKIIESQTQCLMHIPEFFTDTPKYRLLLNLLTSGCIVFFACIGLVLGHFNLACWPVNLQSYMILAIVPIIFYNGKRGYDSKWFRIACYLYYPVHLVILAAIFFVIL